MAKINKFLATSPNKTVEIVNYLLCAEFAVYRRQHHSEMCLPMLPETTTDKGLLCHTSNKCREAVTYSFHVRFLSQVPSTVNVSLIGKVLVGEKSPTPGASSYF